MSGYVVKPGKEHIAPVYTDDGPSDTKMCAIKLDMNLHSGIPLVALKEIRDWAVSRAKRVIKDQEYTYRTKCGKYCGYIYQSWFFVDDYALFSSSDLKVEEK